MARRASLVALLAVDRDGVPLVSSGDVIAENAGWFTCWPHGRSLAPDTFVHLRDQGGGAFVVLGDPALLAAIEARASKAWAGLEALRADTRADAIAVVDAWRDERPRALDGDGRPTGPRVGEKVAMRAAMAGFTEDDAERAAAAIGEVVEP